MFYHQSRLTPRSALYVPADNERALKKATSLKADALIFDLEDAVAPENKSRARQQITQALKQSFLAPIMLRINALESPEAAADQDLLWSLAPEQIAGVVLPKVEPVQTISWLPNWLLDLNLPIWAMIETPLGILRAPEIAEHPRVAGLIAGTNDLAFSLHTQHTADRLPLLYALSAIVLAARAHGKIPLDAVHNHIEDTEGFRQECQQGKELGFSGKTLIHPTQLETTHEVFGISTQEVTDAKELLQTWEDARNQNKSITTWRGQLIEQMHIDRAKEVLLAAKNHQKSPD